MQGKVFSLWGLVFKPNTDDMREAPSRVLMEELWAVGATVRAYDPKVMDEVERIYGENKNLLLCQTADDALIVITEWNVFRSPDFDKIKSTIKDAVILDGRNIYDPAALRQLGFSYYSIGR